MVNIRARDQQKVAGSPRGEVGEIDTAAPFQSVKAAVSLFGEVALSKKPVFRKSKLSSENVLDKETQLVLAQREINKNKKQLETAETIKGRASSELEKAKRTLQDLTTRVQTISKSKQSATEAAEAVKKKAKQLEEAKSQEQLGNAAWKEELDQSREQYIIAAGQLLSAKQQLNQMRQDFDASLEEKLALFQQAAEAQRSDSLNMERISELTKEIKAMQESAQQLKLAAAQVQQQHAKYLEENDAHIQACKKAKEVANKNLASLKEKYDPELTRKLELKLAETNFEVEILQEEMKKAHASEMDAVKVVTAELQDATELLQLIAEEEGSLRNTVTSLRVELENAKREQAELLKKEAEEEQSLLEQLLEKTEVSRRKAEDMIKHAEELKQEAENAKLRAQQAEEKLKLDLKEAEIAKAAEKKAQDDIKMLSEKENAQDNGPDNQIKISLEEFDSLKKKVVECENMAEIKVADAIAQIEAINANKNDAEKKLEANLKAVEEIKQATDMALKSAEAAEAAQIVVEGELRKWHQEEQITED